jgi:hypothetical protein
MNNIVRYPHGVSTWHSIRYQAIKFFFRQFDTNCHKLLCLQGGPCKCIASYGSVSIIHVAMDSVYFVLH